MKSNVATHRAAHEAWLRRDFEATVKDLVPSFTYTDHPRALTVKTRDEFKDWVADWARAFSDGRITEERYIDGGDTTVALFIGVGTNDGPMGPVPATGRRMHLPFCEVLRYAEDGRAVSGEIYYDQLTLMVQLGLAQPPVA